MRIVRNILLAFFIIGAGTTSSFGWSLGWGKKEPEYNRSAQEWYDAIRKTLRGSDLETADKQFLSLRSEHTGSPLIPTVELVLAQAHMAKEEYLLANYYLGEYLKHKSRGAKGEYARFLKLKATFLGIKDINKDQKLVMSTLETAQKFYASHRSGKYAPLVQTIIVRLQMAQYLLNEGIASLYDRTGKEKAAEIYREKNKKFVYTSEQIEDPENGFLSKLNPF